LSEVRLVRDSHDPGTAAAFTGLQSVSVQRTGPIIRSARSPSPRLSASRARIPSSTGDAFTSTSRDWSCGQGLRLLTEGVPVIPRPLGADGVLAHRSDERVRISSSNAAAMEGWHPRCAKRLVGADGQLPWIPQIPHVRHITRPSANNARIRELTVAWLPNANAWSGVSRRGRSPSFLHCAPTCGWRGSPRWPQFRYGVVDKSIRDTIPHQPAARSLGGSGRH